MGEGGRVWERAGTAGMGGSGAGRGPAGPGDGEQEDDPGLVVAGAEVADVGGLEEAGLRA